MPPEQDAKHPPTILNVNDNEHTRYVVTRILKTAGFQVLEAATGMEALELVQRCPDLVLLDVKLPDVDGFEVCRRIKSDPTTCQVSVIHLSAHRTDAAERAHGLEHGAEAYLIQPVERSLLIATVRTVLRTRVAEMELRKTVARLEEERELRERFVLTLSHDLRNPLSAARTNAQIIQRYPEGCQRHVESARKIERSIDRVDAMITDLLDASRIRAGEVLPIEINPCDLVQTIRESVEELLPVHGNRFDLHLPDRLSGYWSCNGIKRIMENLMINGIKYGDPKGVITISLVQEGGCAIISVHNEGAPLSLEDQASIFDQFRRAPSALARTKKGWGLGLTLVRGITEAHRGKVRVESAEGKGTCFFIELPIDAR